MLRRGRAGGVEFVSNADCLLPAVAGADIVFGGCFEAGGARGWMCGVVEPVDVGCWIADSLGGDFVGTKGGREGVIVVVEEGSRLVDVDERV